MNEQSEFPEGSAGFNMVTEVPVYSIEDSLEDIETALVSKSLEFDSLDYIYLTDTFDVLKGVFSVKMLLGTPDKSIKSKDIMVNDLVTVDPNTNQERLVYKALSHGLKSIPVVDGDKKFLGVVTHDHLLQIFNHEVQSDVFNFGGIFHRVGEEYTSIQSSAAHMVRSRLPWLIVGVIGGTLAATLIAQFEELLASFIALASFIPVMVYMSDAAGAQTEALIIRSMALDPHMSIRKYLSREIVVAIVLAGVSGAFAAFLAFLTRQNLILGLIIFLALFMSIIASVTINTFAPLIFKKLNYDPALATGPLATIVSDITTLAIYLGVALLLMQWY